MLFEYGVEPHIMNSWKDFRYLIEKFGISEGRLISRYPRHWKKLVYEAVSHLSVLDRKRIEEGLTRIDEKMKRRRGEWDNKGEWITNAIAEHSKRPFHAIIASANPASIPFVLDVESLNGGQGLWKVTRSLVVRRVAEDIARCVRPFIDVSKHILLVDPYFSPEEIEYRKPLQLILEAISVGDGKVFEVHLNEQRSSSKTYFEAVCKKVLPTIIPQGVQLRIVRWKEKAGGDKLHNRYILSERGGLRFGNGLREADDGQFDEVELLEFDTARDRFEKYAGKVAAFDFVDDIVIAGSK
jgi:hypothetical protein